MPNFVWLLLLMAITAVLVRSSVRARRFPRPFLRWSVLGGASVLAILAAGLSVLTIAGMIKQSRRSAPVPEIKINATLEQIDRGRALADTFCGTCHSKYGPMVGGMDIGKEIAVPVGSFVTTNLTAAGPLPQWSDGQIFRAIRNGVDADGNWLVIMSYTNAGRLSDADTKALIAYLRSLPAVGAETVNPPDHLNLLGLIMLGAGALPAGHPIFAGAIAAPPKGPTVRYGEYVLSYQDCRECHGANLKGGVPGQLGPIGPNLDLVKAWKREEFITTMRTGTDPGGHQITERMPWRALGKMDDEELAAVYEYLTSGRDSQHMAAN
jgi:mono/diheme cytochrome c family protein